jgi:hypothetical protein
MKILNYLKYLLLVPIVLMVVLPIKFFYTEFIDIESEIYWKKHFGTVKNVKLIEYAGEIKGFPYDVFPLYNCEIDYTFDYNNKTYIGNTISSEIGIKGDTINKTFFKKLNGSKKVVVWVNKRNPIQSSLTKKNIITEQLFTAIGMLMLPLLILNLIRISRKNNSKTLVKKLEIYNDR